MIPNLRVPEKWKRTMRASVTVVSRRDGALCSETWALTTDHAMSSYGIPVLVRGSDAYGPADLGPAVLVTHDPIIAGRAEAAGFSVAMNDDEAGRKLGEV